MNHRPVCVKCGVEMRPETNGVGLLDMADFGPCRIWDADKYKCPTCSHEIVVGFAQGPVAHHVQANFNEFVSDYRERNLLIKCRRR